MYVIFTSSIHYSQLSSKVVVSVVGEIISNFNIQIAISVFFGSYHNNKIIKMLRRQIDKRFNI